MPRRETKRTHRTRGSTRNMLTENAENQAHAIEPNKPRRTRPAQHAAHTQNALTNGHRQNSKGRRQRNAQPPQARPDPQDASNDQSITSQYQISSVPCGRRPCSLASLPQGQTAVSFDSPGAPFHSSKISSKYKEHSSARGNKKFQMNHAQNQRDTHQQQRRRPVDQLPAPGRPFHTTQRMHTMEHTMSC